MSNLLASDKWQVLSFTFVEKKEAEKGKKYGNKECYPFVPYKIFSGMFKIISKIIFGSHCLVVLVLDLKTIKEYKKPYLIGVMVPFS